MDCHHSRQTCIEKNFTLDIGKHDMVQHNLAILGRICTKLTHMKGGVKIWWSTLVSIKSESWCTRERPRKAWTGAQSGYYVAQWTLFRIGFARNSRHVQGAAPIMKHTLNWVQSESLLRRGGPKQKMAKSTHSELPLHASHVSLTC